MAKSQDLISAAVFLLIFWALWSMVSFIINQVKMFTIASLKSINKPLNLSDIGLTIFNFSVDFFKVVGPALLVGIVVGLITNFAQVGIMFTTKPLEPKLSKISISLQKIKDKFFFSKTAMFNLVMALVKVVVLSVIFYIVMKSDMDRLVNLSGMEVTQSLGVVGMMMVKLFNAAGIFLLALSLPDYFFHKRQFEDNLKMTKHEQKEEYKEMEGDPLVKNQINEMYQQMLRRQTVRKTVPQADVVVTNPEHYAVALKYTMQEEAPMVLAKGKDDEAQFIKQIARENYVAIEENPPLARQLYNTTEVGQYIPVELFQIVAEILIKLKKF